jgi:hypothetical protein
MYPTIESKYSNPMFRLAALAPPRTQECHHISHGHGHGVVHWRRSPDQSHESIQWFAAEQRGVVWAEGFLRSHLYNVL